MRLLSWNVQWCRGLDGVVDPGRIATEARRLADPDIICLQEVAAGFAELPGSAGEDQPAALARALPGYQPFAAWGVDVAAPGGGRMRFGNLLLSRLPVRQVRRHSLPWPGAEVPTMPRVALEAVVEAPFGPVRVLTTHLEYYAAEHRAAQVARLAQVHAEALARRKSATEAGPFHTPVSPASAILCGDFNLPPDDPLHGEILRIGLVDAWQALYPGEPHPPTFRLHEREAGQAPYCCDFVFVTPELAPRLRAVRVDAGNRASDHQPVIAELQ
ncbi:MAG TPA: endonuclease/exonuclease/phosphatase family protein [Burkholderiales bacterium]|jgi:endonuclease/exonuclease/phosphatase family metal-dependent hydrolase|nr:endonuclease/exonuclease/phosphatase family protein [Burkholderiales bacterium]